MMTRGVCMKPRGDARYLTCYELGVFFLKAKKERRMGVGGTDSFKVATLHCQTTTPTFYGYQPLGFL